MYDDVARKISEAHLQHSLHAAQIQYNTWVVIYAHPVLCQSCSHVKGNLESTNLPALIYSLTFHIHYLRGLFFLQHYFDWKSFWSSSVFRFWFLNSATNSDKLCLYCFNFLSLRYHNVMHPLVFHPLLLFIQLSKRFKRYIILRWKDCLKLSESVYIELF